MNSKFNPPEIMDHPATGERKACSVFTDELYASPGTMNATEMLTHFKKALQTYCEPHGISVSKHRGSHTSENVVKMVSNTGRNIIRVLYVRVRRSGAGFWGITTNQVCAFHGQGHQWDVVLLLGPGERSYLGTSQKVEEGFKKPWSSSASEYKVHESELEGYFAQFDSYAELFFRLLPPATLKQTAALDRTSARTLGPGVARGESGGNTAQVSRKH